MTLIEQQPVHFTRQIALATRNGLRDLAGIAAPATLVILVLAAMGLSMGNQLAMDDLPIIAGNPAVHDPSLAVFIRPYWPEGFSPDLYRPFATLSFALQWALGGGVPLAVHLMSLVMYSALVLAVWGLAKRMIPPGPAWLCAALFAVHPVHVEAVATGVNQGELMVALFLTLATASYIDGRRSTRFGVRRAIAIAFAFALACLYKEHAVVLPGLLLAAELTVLRGQGVGPDFRLLVRLYAALVLETVVFLVVRTVVLGDFAGSFTAEALQGLGIGGRTMTMLGVVPIWLRLLVWPAHLQADYSPGEIVAATTMGPAQWAGLLLVAGSAASALLAWRRAPVWTFGLLWFAVSIVPVANILVATGIVLAERTLLLPSVGLAIGLGGLLAALLARLPGAATRAPAIVALATVVLGLGVIRSALRTQVWNSNDYLWQRTLEDAPLSYRAQHARAQYLFKNGMRAEAEVHFRRAIELFPRSFQPQADLANQYRLADLCGPAIPLYQSALRLAPRRADARLSLVSCLLWEGHYQGAIGQTRLGRGWGIDDPNFLNALTVADSALLNSAPRHTVRLRALRVDGGLSTAGIVGKVPATP
jgi:hypothetical protein